MRKRSVALWITAPFILVLVLVGVLISPLGSPLLANIGAALVEDLEIEAISGSPLSDFTVNGLSWHNPQWKVEVKEASINLVLGCFLSKKVCVDTLTTQGVTVTQTGEAAEQEPPSDETGFAMPVTVIINQASFKNTTVNMPGQKISLASLFVSGRAADKITLDPVELEGLFIDIPATAKPDAQTPPSSYALSYSAPELPEIKTPIPIQVSSLSLKNAQLQTGDEPQKLNLLSIDNYQFTDYSMQLSRLHVEHEMGQADLSLAVTLQDKYPLETNLNARFTLPDGQSQQVNVTLNGMLSALDVSVVATGQYQADLQLTADILNDQLPVDMKATWPQQPLPGLPEGNVYNGQITARGEMGNYQITGSTAVDAPEIGRVPLDVDIVLNRKNITVNSLDADLLNGSVSNSGTLYLDEAISWSGTTKLKNISTTSLVSSGPTDLSGQFTSLMQYNSKGIQASLTDINITGLQGGFDLSLSGSAVYSGPNEILVTSIQLTQGENQAEIAGQLIKNRLLKGTVQAQLTQLTAIYPGLSGSVTADIDISGEWQDPGAQGSVALNDLQVPASLNPSLAQQGPLSGELSVSGKLSDHHVETSVNLPEHALAVVIDGGWEGERWKGTLSDSTIGIFSTRWELGSPFTVAVRPSPFSTKITAHCWESRKEGQLCVNDLLYKDSVARWDIDASKLPVGLWASEFLGDIVPQPPEATASLATQGRMRDGERPQGIFNFNVTPATWKLGENGNVAIEVDAIEASGELKADELVASASLKSEQLGDIVAHITTQPFASTPTIDGNIRLDNINVAPLKPISPAIRELTGSINGDIALDGNLTAPQLNGDLKLANGNIDIEDTPAAISDWTQDIRFKGNRAEFDGQFALGPGTGQLQGSIDWSSPQQPEITLSLTGDRLEVQQRDITLRVSPDLNATVSPEAVKVSGEVRIPWARIKIEELPESAVAPSKDVHLRGEPPSEDPLSIVNADVDVIIDDNKSGEVKVEAFGLTANLTGHLQVKTQPALVGYGALQVMDGRFQAYGQDLIIRTGEVQFNGPLDQPNLLVEAIRPPAKTDDGVIAGVRIDGMADSPNISIFSNPAMDQSRSLSYLLTGSAEFTGGGGDTSYGAVLLGLGLSNTSEIQGQLGEALGIQDFSIGTTAGSAGNDPKLSLSGQINDRLSIRYNFDVGLRSGDSAAETVRRRSVPPDLALRYRWMPQFYAEAIQTTIEEQAVFALDFYYQFFLGKEPEKGAPQSNPTEQENPDNTDSDE
ncbi:translocation/assembly module TamB domain-containing protein [Salinimonas chungwhensis]|uniref:translocation/assembly module TamB domain-containing protein n=1 Tax=Salinimonas chungwhensis TaxID=265425 RepID=UPI000368D415|nr:translocation/assembly module TamB domain-containing protein [Salinimonas chungwhensis]